MILMGQISLYGTIGGWKWSEREDLNLRPLAPHASQHTKALINKSNPLVGLRCPIDWILRSSVGRGILKPSKSLWDTYS